MRCAATDSSAVQELGIASAKLLVGLARKTCFLKVGSLRASIVSILRASGRSLADTSMSAANLNATQYQLEGDEPHPASPGGVDENGFVVPSPRAHADKHSLLYGIFKISSFSLR